MNPGVDFEHGRLSSLGRTDLQTRIVQAFVGSRGDDASSMQRALAAADFDSLRYTAHTIVPSADTVGALRLSFLARNIEAAVFKRSDPEALKELVDAFAAEHALVMDQLRGFLLRTDPAPPGKAS